MQRLLLYAYVDGSDLHAFADRLEARLTAFVAGGTWGGIVPRVVNQQRRDDLTLGPDDLPDWELGLNLDLPDAPPAPVGWAAEVERMMEFLGDLAAEYGRDFVVGIGNTERGESEDLFFIDSPQPDLQMLRQAIGVRDPA